MSNKPAPTISVVIPSWNSESQLRQNLPSVIKAASRVKAEIVIVDDASTDQSLAVLNQDWSYKIKVDSHPQNLGYGATINQAVKLAQGDLVVVLNTDVRPEIDCFENAIKYFAQKDIFAVALNSGEGAMRVVWERGLFHHFRDDSPSLSAPISLWASGGQGVFDREKWLNLGGMDSLYKPFYWEDTDLGYNAWKRGWRILWAKDCHCIHDHQKSVIAKSFDQKEISLIAQRNQFLFVWKNISDVTLLLSHLLYLPFYFWQYPKTLIAAIQQLPKALRHRSHIKSNWQRSDRDILNLWK